MSCCLAANPLGACPQGQDDHETVHSIIEATGAHELAPSLWAAAYLHEIARTHDGRCYVHGENTVRRLQHLPDVRALFARGGVKETDLPAIETAVIHHCKPPEPEPSHWYYPLTALLKDADGLNRVRLGDLNPYYLRHPVARTMVDYAQRLFDQTDDGLEPRNGGWSSRSRSRLRARGGVLLCRGRAPFNVRDGVRIV